MTRGEASCVLEACPDYEWRLLFALSRYGGLRCPSEHLALRWNDIDWERERFLVHSAKTERHEGGASRWVPIFPELRPYLDDAWAQAGEGAEFVITRYRDDNANLRTQLRRIIKRAGVAIWPKLFQNLRASRATELAAEHPAHVAAAWLGHSTTIANKHYWQVTEDDFKRATKAAQKAAQSERAAPRYTSLGPNCAEKQNAALPVATSYSELLHNCIVGEEGLEPPTSTV